MLQMFKRATPRISDTLRVDLHASPVNVQFGDTTLMSNVTSTYSRMRSPHESPLVGVSMGERNPNHQKIVNVLSEARMPMDVENIRSKTGLKNWESTKSILLELVLQGTILGQKTTKGWIFWVDSTPMRNKRRES
jgi:hypothetical protein